MFLYDIIGIGRRVVSFFYITRASIVGSQPQDGIVVVFDVSLKYFSAKVGSLIGVFYVGDGISKALCSIFVDLHNPVAVGVLYIGVESAFFPHNCKD